MFRFFDRLPPPAMGLRIVDVGAASMGEGTDPYTALLGYPFVTVVGFDADEQQCAARNASAPAGCRYLAKCIADGRPRIFHECANPLTSSLYEPDPDVLGRFLGMDLPVVARRSVETARLDDLDLGDVDLLKIDAQGAELDVMQGARSVLSRAAIVHTEVEFLPLYKGQPLFGDVDVDLRAQGFMFHRFIGLYAGKVPQLWQVVHDKPAHHEGSQLLFAEAAVYLRDIAGWPQLAPAKLLGMAGMLHDMYRSFDFACLALEAYDRATGTTHAPSYLEALRVTWSDSDGQSGTA